MTERVRLAVDCAMSAVRHLEPDELDEAITEIEREMIAMAERRGMKPPTLMRIARAAASTRTLVDEDGRGSGVCPVCDEYVEAGRDERVDAHKPDCGIMLAKKLHGEIGG